MSSIEQSRSQVTGDEDLLANFGYNQQLQRTLGRFSQFALAFSIISLTTGIFTNFSFGLNAFGPAMVWLWPTGIGRADTSDRAENRACRLPGGGTTGKVPDAAAGCGCTRRLVWAGDMDR